MPPGVSWLFSGSCSYINAPPRWISFKLSARVLKGSQLGLSLRWKKIEAWYHFTHVTPRVWPCVSGQRAFVFPDCLWPKTHESGGTLWPHNSPVVITATNGPSSVRATPAACQACPNRHLFDERGIPVIMMSASGVWIQINALCNIQNVKREQNDPDQSTGSGVFFCCFYLFFC